MRVRGVLPLALLFVLGLQCAAQAQEAGSSSQGREWWLVTFSEQGHADVRKMLHARPRYKDFSSPDEDPEMPMREYVAVEPAASGGDALVLAMYEGMFLCGSRGCPLEVLHRDTRGAWRILLDVSTDKEFVAFGPKMSHGLKDIVFLGRHQDGFACPIWRFDGKRYLFRGLMDTESQPCRALNEAREALLSSPARRFP